MMNRPTSGLPFDERAASGGGVGEEGSSGPRRVANVYLRHPANTGRGGRRLGLLARALGLELYSPTLLTRKNHAELTVLAVMLVGVFSFELLAWSFFFNGIFVGEMFRLHPTGTPAAIVLAFLFAATILYFERQVVTADATRLPKWKKVCAFFLRLGVILVAGFIVAHSIDLVVFRAPMQLELHRRAVREKADVLRRDLDALRADDPRRTTLRRDIERLHQNMNRFHDNQIGAAALVEQLRRQSEQHERDAGRSQDELDRVEGGATAGGAGDREIENARRRADSASDAVDSARAAYNEAYRSLQGLDRRLEDLQEQERQLAAELRELAEKDFTEAENAASLEQRARHWLSQVARERPSGPADYAQYVEDISNVPAAEREKWGSDWREPFELDPPNASFFEKLEVIYDLLGGASEGGSASSANSLLSSEALAMRQPRRSLYLTTYSGVHLAVMLLPFLVLAVKWLLLPKEVDAYFSTWHQAHAGDAEARLMLSVEEKVRGEQELW